jgi:hypothetical protein
MPPPMMAMSTASAMQGSRSCIPASHEMLRAGTPDGAHAG